MDTAIITALIGSAGVVIVALINNLRKEAPKNAEKAATNLALPAASRDARQTSLELRPGAAPPHPGPVIPKEDPSERKEFVLSHGHILRTIENTPVAGQEDVARSYVGTRVRWSGKYTGITRHAPDLTRVSFMLTEDSSSLFCYVDPAHCPSLSRLTPLFSHAIVEVSGKIKRVTLGQTELEHCEFVPLA